MVVTMEYGFFMAHEKSMMVHACADIVRRNLGAKFNLYGDKYSFLWVDRFSIITMGRGGETLFFYSSSFYDAPCFQYGFIYGGEIG